MRTSARESAAFVTRPCCTGALLHNCRVRPTLPAAMRTLERGLAAGVPNGRTNVLLSIPLSGARPTLSGADAGPMTAALGGVVFAGLGVWLFVRVGLRDRRMAARISRVVGFQERGREFRKRAVMEGKSGNAASAKAEADAWVGGPSIQVVSQGVADVCRGLRSSNERRHGLPR